MKRQLILISLLLCVAMQGWAQHTLFMGMSMERPLEDFRKMLTDKGFVEGPSVGNSHINAVSIPFYGTWGGVDRCLVDFMQDSSDKSVFEIFLQSPVTTDTLAIQTYWEKMKKELTAAYGEGKDTGEKSSQLQYRTGLNNVLFGNGNIKLVILDMHVGGTDVLHFSVNVEIKDKGHIRFRKEEPNI